MFAQIKSVVDAVLSGFKAAREIKDQISRDRAIEDMLCFYFLLKDCVDEGESLIVDAGSNPVAKLAAMSASDSTAVARSWDQALWRQGRRLRILEGLLFGQSHLVVINPQVVAELHKAIGYKINRATTLHGIGAALFLRTVFPIKESDQQKGELIALMAGEPSRTAIDLERIRGEVAALRDSLERYRVTVQTLASPAEILKLSASARKRTLAPTQ